MRPSQQSCSSLSDWYELVKFALLHHTAAVCGGAEKKADFIKVPKCEMHFNSRI